MKKKKLISLVCVAVLSQYGIPTVTTLAAEQEEAAVETSNSEELKKDPILDTLPMSSTESIEEEENNSEGITESTGSSEETTVTESTETEEEKTLNWELKDPQQILVSGDDFVVKIKGNQSIAKIEIPENITYDVQKNIEELRPLIYFDKENRELTISQINEYAEIELVLTTEKAGEYELQMTNEADEKIGEKISLVVAEKENKEEITEKETAETKEATIKETKKEAKKQTRAGTEDNRVIMNTTSTPDTEVTSVGERIIYATTISHTDSTKAINNGKIIITIENGKFKDFPTASSSASLKASSLSSDGKTITLTLNDGLSSGNFESYTYSAYPSVGIADGEEVKVTSQFTGQFSSESVTFENNVEKSVRANFGGSGTVDPVAPGTNDWKTSGNGITPVYSGNLYDPAYGLMNNNQKEGFKNLRVKYHFSDESKINWFYNFNKRYTVYFQGGGTKTSNITEDMIDQIDNQTYIINYGELNPMDVRTIYFGVGVQVPNDAVAGDQAEVNLTIMENDTEIFTNKRTYNVVADETRVVFNSSKGSQGSEVTKDQSFYSIYNVSGGASKTLSDLEQTIDVPNEISPKKILNGVVNGNNGGGKSISKVEYSTGAAWIEAPIDNNEDFVLPEEPIEKIKIKYVSLKNSLAFYQPVRVEWELKKSIPAGTNFVLKHQLSYTDAYGVPQNPDISSQDLPYEVVETAITKETKAVVAQYNRTIDFDKGAAMTGDKFRMNYRLGVSQGKIDQPYIFVKVPEGVSVKNTYNLIQYPYANTIDYNSSPSYGKTVTPISKANNTGFFKASDGSVVYYYKADDTSLTREDFIQMLFIDNEYTIENIKSGIYEIEVGMGSLTENNDDVTLNSGYETSALSAEMQSKLGASATTYYSKKTKLTVGKVDKVTTSVAVKGSEDAAWLDSSKTGKVIPGKKVSYRVSVKNEGTENYSNVSLVNILPYVGDTLVSSGTARNSQFQINLDSSGVSVKYNGGEASGITLEYSLSNNPIRFSSPNGDPIGTDPWTSSVSDFSKVRAIRINAPSVTLKPGDEITLEYSGIVVLDAQRPQIPGESFVANNSVAYRFQTDDGAIRAGEPSVSKVETIEAQEDGLISGNVYIDLDKDGNKTGSEPGLNQVEFELFKKDSSGKFVTTNLISESSSNFSGDNGVFGFTDLEYGTYKVKVKLPATKGAAFITSGTDKVEKIDDTTAWVTRNGSSELTINDSSSTSHEMKDLSVPLFVNTPLNGTISFKDKDGNVVTSDCGKDFKVELYKGSSKIAETTAEANGLYTFEDLSIDSKADYKIKVTIPKGKTFVFTSDNTAGELTVNMEPGIGTIDPTDLYITDTDAPTAAIVLVNGRGAGTDVNPDSVTLSAADDTTSFSTAWKISKGSTVEYSGSSDQGSISLQDQINYLIGDKKAGDYTVEMTVTDFAGNQTTATKNFSLKFGSVRYMNGATEHGKEENLLLYVDKLTKPATDPTKAGYTFDQWVKSDNSEWNFSTGIISDESVELKATFKAVEQTITFDVNGGDSASKPADIKKDTDATVDLSGISVPTRPGYTFKHWYKQGDVGRADIGSSMTMPAGGMTLVAEWEANSYKVSFDKNGGTGTMADQNFSYDTSQNLTANSFTRDGYSFQGWATSKTGTKKYEDNENVKNLSSVVNGTITLYAVWQATEQTLTFDVNGGDSASTPADIKKDTDATVDLSAVTKPTRTGYTFKHWYKQGDASKTDVGASLKMPAGGMTLVAEWEANSYKITFDKNDGTGTMVDQSFKYDTAQNLPANKFTRAGYSFQGWSTKKTGSYMYLDGALVNNLSDEKNGTVTLYAIWQADNQILQFDVNGGEITSKPANISSDTDSSIDLSGVTNPTRTGYTFKHWYKQGDSSKADVGNSLKMPAGGATLVAEWEANQYTITFHKNGGTGTMTNQSFSYDETKKLTKNGFTREGYTFAGWSTTVDSVSSYTDEATVSNLTADKNGTIDLYAKWSASAQIIEFDVNGGEITSKPGDISGDTDSTIDLSNVTNPTRAGYTFKHWYKQGDSSKADVGTSIKMPAKGMILVAEWEANKYKVKFNANGGTETMSDQDFVYDKVQALTENKFKRAGYTFTGWSTTASGEASYADKASVTNLTATANGVYELFAVWMADNQTIQFDVNGGAASSKPQDIVKGTDSNVDLTKVAAPTRTGYTFKHWYKQGDQTKAPVSGTITMPAGGMILAAEWEANKYTVTFNANDGIGTMADQAFVYDQEQPLTANTFTRKNYDFVGWATTKAGDVKFTDQEVVKNLTDDEDGSQTLYAVWKLQERVISFDVNGGDVSTQPKDIRRGIGEEVDLDKVTAPTREGYAFDYWYEKEDAAKGAVSGTIPMPDKNTVLIAAWKANQYTVKFDANGGEGTMSDQKFTYDAEQTLMENAFKRTNNDFVGWALAKEDVVVHYDKDSVKNLTTKNGETITLYAIWEKKPILPVLKANNIVLTTEQVEEFSKDNILNKKIAELSDAKVVDENTNDILATYEKINVDISNVKEKKGVYKAKLSYETKARATTDSKEIDVTVIEPSKKTQKITFDVNGGDVKTQPADISAPVGTTVSLKEVKNPTRSGYIFSGWFDGEPKVGETVEMPENGMKLVAHWSQKDTGGSATGGSNGSGSTNTNVLGSSRGSSASASNKSLPKTNDTNSIGLSISGLMLALLAFFGLKKKKDEDSESESK
jgi:LPXTG-motif cell wall-anchored protein/uncharacterized repeat protein (TIGR02543 family)/uncharacterized repeat protein (TIGR01451 family)